MVFVGIVAVIQLDGPFTGKYFANILKTDLLFCYFSWIEVITLRVW